MSSKVGYNKFNPKEIDEFIKKYFQPHYKDDENTIIAFHILKGEGVSILERKFRRYFEWFSNVKLFKKDEDFSKKFKNNEFDFFNTKITQQIIKKSKNLDSFYKGKDEKAYKEQQKNSILNDCSRISHDIEGLTIRNYFDIDILSAIKLFKEVYSVTKDKKIEHIIENLEKQIKVFEE